ncbi:MAG: hypothetical protein CL573_03170 [Alphaproteobacteria bacterium]|nr:hypothetical protein [Alphaproteobacteria bacterium]HCP01588.1 hypothetical protein [Rhodospirillaceae bacterium]
MSFCADEIRRLSLQFTMFASAMVFAGCSGIVPTPPEDIQKEFPASAPRATVTNFNQALVCLDNLMVIHQSQPIYLATQGLNNFTSDRSISDGGKEMLITALAQMSNRSRGVRFVSFGSDIRDILDLQGAHPDKGDFRVPDYFIRGGVTQHNKNLWSGQEGAGASTEFRGDDSATGSFSLLGGYGSLTVDMSAGFISNLQIVPGAVTSNTLALQNTEGTSLTADLTLGDLGFSYSLSENVSRDFNMVYRALVQVGAVELIGRLQNLPYWRCLANAGAAENRDRQLLERFEQLNAADRSTLVRIIQQALKDSGYYDGPITGAADDATMVAVDAYQQQHNVLATGRIDFDTFKLLNLYTPARDLPYVQWWENDPKVGKVGAPFGVAASVAVPIGK